MLVLFTELSAKVNLFNQTTKEFIFNFCKLSAKSRYKY